MSATTAALDTYELLEHIIAHLPPRDISRAQRVCKIWHQVIQGSKKIAEAHVLRPTSRDGKWRADVYPEETLVTMFPDLFRKTSTSRKLDKRVCAVAQSFDLTLSEHGKYLSRPDIMLTDPAITNAHITYSCPAVALTVHCELYDASGITIQHAIQTAVAMVTTDLLYGGRRWLRSSTMETTVRVQYLVARDQREA